MSQMGQKLKFHAMRHGPLGDGLSICTGGYPPAPSGAFKSMHDALPALSTKLLAGTRAKILQRQAIG
jgi:hypothetical protein